MICNQCGTSNSVGAAFCAVCGKQLENGAGSSPVMPKEEEPVSVATQAPAGEYIPAEQEMPPPVSSPISQEEPTIRDAAQAGYGIPQSYPPPTYPPGDQFRSAEMFGPSQPAYAGQTTASIENEQPLPPIPPYVYPEGPVTPPPMAREPWYRALAKPMPLWALIGCIVAVILLLVAMQLTGSDWAAGAMRVGIVAGVLALVVALVAVVRSLLGMVAKSNPKRVLQLVSAGLAILLLLLLSLVGISQQSTIHGLQAHSWEGQQQWEPAIKEFQLAGEGAPTSDNISRVYNEWGEQFSAIQHYPEAFPKFDIVLNNYSLATAEVARAQVDKIKAYFAWAQQASQHHEYSAATTRLDALLQLNYCDANCQSQANALDATAYYNLAKLQLSALQYDGAVTSLQALITRFSSSLEAQKVHGDFAKALFGQGQQQLTTSCPSAIPTYQQLSTKFADTPEGQKATTALKAPQKVKGRFTGSIPNDPALTRVAALMKGLYTSIPADQLGILLFKSPQTTIAKDGSFVFGPQPQGSYELAWGTSINATGAGLLTWDTVRYVANVGPLCPYDFGDIYQNIPKAL